ncbi:MAG TPA: hypothetical protein VNO52_03995 [Methylomirabilota bacterium]|nr:hypothetical protein [Methylomirabilota bacterium]
MKTPSPAPSALILAPGGARCERPAFLGFLAVCLGAVVLSAGPFAPGRLREMLPLVVVGAATVATLGHLAASLPAQNVVAIALVNAAGGVLGFRPTREGGMPLLCPGLLAEGALGNVPLPILSATLFWITNVLGARAAAAWVLRPWRQASRYGLGLVAVAAGLATVGVALLAERSPAGLTATFVFAVVQLILCVPWLVDKRGLRHPVAVQPALTWALSVGALLLIGGGTRD